MSPVVSVKALLVSMTAMPSSTVTSFGIGRSHAISDSGIGIHREYMHLAKLNNGKSYESLSTCQLLEIKRRLVKVVTDLKRAKRPEWC
jgi:hypothetical protein